MMEKLKFLPPTLVVCLKKLDFNRLYELRLRADKPVRVCYGGEFFYLSNSGELSHQPKTDSLRLSAAQISEIVLRAAQFSIYAVGEQLSSGFLTVAGGIRLGLAGFAVYENGKIKTQKNFSSLVIRIPHEIKGSANSLVSALKTAKSKNLLLVSPPGCGKTTILRDLARQISNAGANTLLVDERSELAACHDGIPSLDVGVNTDVITGARKDYAFSFGIRSLRPDYIITDELFGSADAAAVKNAASSGVFVIASAHADDTSDLKQKPDLSALLDSKIFDRYVFLSLRNGAGTVEQILNAQLLPA